MSRFKKCFVVLTAASVLSTACNKNELITPQSNDPVFTVEGTFDGEPIHLVAGDNEAYMHTDLILENGVDVFRGLLSDGETSVEVSIFDGSVDLPDHGTIQRFPSEFTYRPIASGPIVTLSKEHFTNAVNINHVKWKINGVNYTADSVSIYEPGIYNVCAEILFNDDTGKTMCSELILGYQRSTDCTVKCSVDKNNLAKMSVDSVPSSPISEVKWSLEGEEIGNATGLDSVPIGMRTYLLSMDILFKNEVKRTMTMIVNGGLNEKFVGDLSSFETEGTVLKNDFNIELKVTRNGTTYSSRFVDNSSFSVIPDSITHYGEDHHGNNVYKIKATIHALVSDQEGGTTHEVSLNVVLGVPVPH